MAIFGSSRDQSLFRHLNRELLWDVITQQCAIYRLNVVETPTNIYGEAAHERYYEEPVLLNTLIVRENQAYSNGDMGVDMNRNMEFRFFRDDLVDAQIRPEIGDIILYQENYFEVNELIENQLHVGKDPNYPYESNPLNPGLDQFGANISIICKAHKVPDDKVQITRERL